MYVTYAFLTSHIVSHNYISSFVQLPVFVLVRDFGDDVLGFVLRVLALCHARGQTSSSFRGSDSAQPTDVVVSCHQCDVWFGAHDTMSCECYIERPIDGPRHACLDDES